MDWKSATRLLRRRQSNTTAAAADDDNGITNIKLSKKLQEYFSQTPLDSSSSVKTFQEAKDEQDLRALHSFLAELFAGVAAVKSAYAELQLAQTPYSVDSIHAADRSLVSELKYLSSLKHSFLKDPLSFSPPSTSYQQSQLRELKELVKTFKINISKLETELQSKDSQLHSLRSHLDQIERKNQSLLSPPPPPQLIMNHGSLSGPSPIHFLPELRLTVKSIRSFARAMMKSMAESPSKKFDLNSAARAMYPNIVPDSKNLSFFFQSFVSHKMFSDFHRPDFNLGLRLNREEFFREFHESKLLSPGQFLSRRGDFVKAKFSATVHPKIIDDDSGGSDLFPRFVEMSRSVWSLHCLFFSFGRGSEEFSGSIFRVRSGCRFSEVYMESVADPDPYSTPTVGFTVVPGFLLGSTVLQCKVYLSPSSS